MIVICDADFQTECQGLFLDSQTLDSESRADTQTSDSE